LNHYTTTAAATTPTYIKNVFVFKIEEEEEEKRVFREREKRNDNF
jgi:hypothetical protein